MRFAAGDIVLVSIGHGIEPARVELQERFDTPDGVRWRAKFVERLGSLVVDPEAIIVNEDRPPVADEAHLVLSRFRRLMANEKHILSLRYGFDTGKMRTLDEVSEMVGLSRYRVRQIEMKALAAIRREVEAMHAARNLQKRARSIEPMPPTRPLKRRPMA